MGQVHYDSGVVTPRMAALLISLGATRSYQEFGGSEVIMRTQGRPLEVEQNRGDYMCKTKPAYTTRAMGPLQGAVD